ncbi:MAG: FKBP-type peptidyl-prolyl cis-trans isomerase [Ferruginibacter sp.]
MKTIFIFLFFTSAVFSSCKKNETLNCAYTAPSNVASSSEISYLQNYITTNSIIATQHESGVFYTVTKTGTGSYPTICSNITVKYVGSILGGNVFDSNTSVTGVKFDLGNLIVGWQRVLPILRTGGNITLYIPPSLGYGSSVIKDSNGNVIIPAGSYLKFDIELLDVQ